MLPVVLYTVSAQGVSLLSLKNTVFHLVDFIASIGWIICYLTEAPSFTLLQPIHLARLNAHLNVFIRHNHFTNYNL